MGTFFPNIDNVCSWIFKLMLTDAMLDLLLPALSILQKRRKVRKHPLKYPL